MGIFDNNGRRFGLSAFVLKIIACVTMAIDHVGAYLLPQYEILRIIGRVAFPIFAFFIAEGCRYTRNKPKRFLTVFGLALLCEAGYLIAEKTWTGTVLLTFSCSILMIYAVQAFKKALTEKRAVAILLSSLALGGSFAIGHLSGKYLSMDYGFAGALLPVLISLFDYREGAAPRFMKYLDNHLVRMVLFTVGVIGVWYFRGCGEIQFYSLIAVLPMAFYNGRPGPKKFKYWFYLFYPAHLLIIELIGRLL